MNIASTDKHKVNTPHAYMNTLNLTREQVHEHVRTHEANARSLTAECKCNNNTEQIAML